MVTQIPDDLKLSSYNYDLPTDRVATRPIPGRHFSKLLVYHAQRDQITHSHFYQLADHLPENHLLVMNQSKVFPCRLRGVKVKGGGRVEIFFLSLEKVENEYRVLLKASGKRKVGEEFLIMGTKEDKLLVKLISLEAEGKGVFGVEVQPSSSFSLISFLEKYGQVPIPPYIRGGQSDQQDKEDYQTVYAQDIGSVAVPTAGLHFTGEVFKNLKERGLETAAVSLHVGLSTFAPVKSENLLGHKMHEEFYQITSENSQKIKKFQGKIIAVGTTSLRVLESCYHQGKFKIPNTGIQGRTSIFLHPGRSINSIQGLITNFHLPQSTLLVLVSALIGRQKTLDLYQEAIRNEYRFFSYGDAMLILL